MRRHARCRRPSRAELVFHRAEARCPRCSHLFLAPADCDGNCLPGSLSISLPWKPLGTRFRISCELLDGSSWPMETGHRLSALGGVGAVRVWRGTIYFLSSCLMDHGSRTGCSFAME